MPRVVHFEIHASNPEALVGFYTGLFGWKISRWGEMPYWLVETGAEGDPGINGGLLKRMGSAPVEGQAVNAFVCTVEVPSVNDFVARALDLGGSTAVPRMSIAGVGWLAYVKDSDGSIVGLMQTDPAAK